MVDQDVGIITVLYEYIYVSISWTISLALHERNNFNIVQPAWNNFQGILSYVKTSSLSGFQYIHSYITVYRFSINQYTLSNPFYFNSCYTEMHSEWSIEAYNLLSASPYSPGGISFCDHANVSFNSFKISMEMIFFSVFFVNVRVFKIYSY